MSSEQAVKKKFSKASWEEVEREQGGMENEKKASKEEKRTVLNTTDKSSKTNREMRA